MANLSVKDVAKRTHLTRWFGLMLRCRMYARVVQTFQTKRRNKMGIRRLVISMKMDIPLIDCEYRYIIHSDGIDGACHSGLRLSHSDYVIGKVGSSYVAYNTVFQSVVFKRDSLYDVLNYCMVKCSGLEGVEVQTKNLYRLELLLNSL
jgi:hypothetical protein